MATDTRHKIQRSTPPRRTAAARVEHEQNAHGPFGVMRQMQDEVDRWFNRFGVDPSWASPSAWMASAAEAAGKLGEWMPSIDAFQRGNEFVVRADVPGMTRNDLTVEVGEDAVTISGERKHDQKEEKDGVFWSERSYGTFCRVVPLPPGAISESAKANFNNGVLEIVMQAPSPESRRGRKIDITGHDEMTKKTV
jgi:HSP20 family protein